MTVTLRNVTEVYDDLFNTQEAYFLLNAETETGTSPVRVINSRGSSDPAEVRMFWNSDEQCRLVGGSGQELGLGEVYACSNVCCRVIDEEQGTDKLEIRPEWLCDNVRPLDSCIYREPDTGAFRVCCELPKVGEPGFEYKLLTRADCLNHPQAPPEAHDLDHCDCCRFLDDERQDTYEYLSIEECGSRAGGGVPMYGCEDQQDLVCNFGADECRLTCCARGFQTDFEILTGFKEGDPAVAKLEVEGVAPGKVVLRLRQQTSTPLAFAEQYPGSNIIALTVEESAALCVPSVTVGGSEASPFMWEESYTCIDSGGNCSEEDVRIPLALVQNGKDVDWEIVGGDLKGSKYSGELCDTSFRWTSNPGTATEEGCSEFTANSFNKRSFGSGFDCVGIGWRAGSPPTTAPTCKELATTSVDYDACPPAPPASPIDGPVACDGEVIVMPDRSDIACIPPDVTPCDGCDDYCIGNGFLLGSSGERCAGGFCECDCTYCRPVN